MSIADLLSSINLTYLYFKVNKYAPGPGLLSIYKHDNLKRNIISYISLDFLIFACGFVADISVEICAVVTGHTY